jgi:hypothetical protein
MKITTEKVTTLYLDAETTVWQLYEALGSIQGSAKVAYSYTGGGALVITRSTD